jgi:glycosyltransferase involved in cell wall biosynthesis
MQHCSRLSIALDASLGWTTVRQNWKDLYPCDISLIPDWIDIDRVKPVFAKDFRYTGIQRVLERVQMSQTVNKQLRDVRPDVALIGNMALNFVRMSRRIPIFTMLDATQKQLQAFGSGYGIYPSRFSSLEGLKHNLRRRAYKRCAGIFSFSEWAKRSLVADYGVDSGKVHVIPHGAVLDRWQQRARRETNSKICNILFVGGAFLRKGGRTLLDWAARTKDQNWHLDVVTQDRMSTTDSRIVIHNGIAPQDPRLTDLFATADLFVLPSLVDCSPSAIAEALASGLPVVASDVGGIPEFVIQGVTGFAIPIDQTQRWDDSLSMLINDPAARRRMSEAAREDAQARFDAKKNIRTTLDVIASFMSRSI